MCMYMYIHVHVHNMYIYTYMYVLLISAFLRIYVHVCAMYIYVYMYTSIYTCTYVLRTCTYMYIRIYINYVHLCHFMSRWKALLHIVYKSLLAYQAASIYITSNVYLSISYNRLFMRPRKLCILAKKDNFKCMWIIFMRDSTCSVAMLRT